MNSFNKTSEVLMAEMAAEQLIRDEFPEVNLYFDYQETDLDTELYLVTISKTHGERFLFHKIKSLTKLSCLNLMIEYIRSDYKKNYQNYEIVWRKKEDKKDTVSWFCGRSFLDVMEKFFHLKDSQDIIIFEVKLKPMA